MVLSIGIVNLLFNFNIFELYLSRFWIVKLGKGNDKGMGFVRVNLGERYKIDL